MHICAARKCISSLCEFEFSRLRKRVSAGCENAFSRRRGNTGLHGNSQNLVFFCILHQRTIVATAKMQFRGARKSFSGLCENEFRNGEIVRSAPRESVFSRRAKMHFYTARNVFSRRRETASSRCHVPRQKLTTSGQCPLPRAIRSLSS